MKRYFKSKQLTTKLQKKIESALDASETKRQDFKKVYVRYTREGQAGFKLRGPDVRASISVRQSTVSGEV